MFPLICFWKIGRVHIPLKMGSRVVLRRGIVLAMIQSASLFRFSPRKKNLCSISKWPTSFWRKAVPCFCVCRQQAYKRLDCSMSRRIRDEASWSSSLMMSSQLSPAPSLDLLRRSTSNRLQKAKSQKARLPELDFLCQRVCMHHLFFAPLLHQSMGGFSCKTKETEF